MVVLGIFQNSQKNVPATETCIIRLHFVVLSSQFSEKFKVSIKWPDLFNARMQIIVTLSAVYQYPQFTVIIMNLFSDLFLKIRSSYSIKIEIEIEKIEKLTLFVRNVCGITFITGPWMKQTKSENDRLPHHLFFYRLCLIRSFIHESLGTIYRFRIDLSKYRLSHTHIKLHFTQFVQKWIVRDVVQ